MWKENTNRRSPLVTLLHDLLDLLFFCLSVSGTVINTAVPILANPTHGHRSTANPTMRPITGQHHPSSVNPALRPILPSTANPAYGRSNFMLAPPPAK